MSSTNEIYENCANCGQFSKRGILDSFMFSATFCCSRCRKEYYSTRPIRRNLRKALATFYIVIIILVLLNAETSKKEPEKSVSPVATQKTETSQEKTEKAPTSGPEQKTETLQETEDKVVSPVAASTTEISQEKTEIAAPPVVAEKASAITIVQPPQFATLASLLPIEKSSDKIPVQADQENSQSSPSKPEVSLSLNDAMSAQEQVIHQKVSGVLDLLGQLKQHLESDEAGSKDEIRNRLKAISEAAIGGSNQLKASAELSKLRAALVRLEEESRQNMRLSATARAKTQELLLIKRQVLERIEKLSSDSIKKLAGYEDSCSGWLSDFDTLWKIDGLQPASKQLLNDLSKLQELKTITQPKAPAEIPKAVAMEEPAFENAFRTWTTTTGVSTKARILSANRINIMMEREDGTTFAQPEHLLIPEDRLLASRFSSLSPSATESPERKQVEQLAMYVAQKTSDGYLNIRSGPGLQNSTVGRIPSGAGGILQTGETIHDTKEQVIWMPVRYAEVSGYVSSAFLKPATERKVEAETLKPQRMMPSPVVGSLLTIQLSPEVSQSFCAIPSGSFAMGSPGNEDGRSDDENQVNATLSQSFWLARTEVTQSQWEALMGRNPSKFKGPNLPVESVNWDDAQAFITKLNNRQIVQDGWKFVLPTEAEWEYACRAGVNGLYSVGSLDEVGWHSENGGRQTHEVAQMKPNGWGLYDMHGNVWEWCADFYEETLKGGIDPAGPFSGSRRALRGGSWFNSAAYSRPAQRYSYRPGYRGNHLSFRPALVPSR